MAGQLIKKGEQKYLLRVFMGRDPETGKRHFLYQTLRGTKKQAEQALTQLLHAKDTGTLLEPTKMSLDTLLNKWLETAVKPRVSERSHGDYGRIAARYVRPTLGKRLVTNIKPYDIQALYAGMLERGLSPQTIRHAQNIIHNAYEQAIRWQLVRSNPAQHVDLPKRSHVEMLTMTEAESLQFKEAAKADSLYALFELFLGTGVSPSEAAGLKWTDLDTVTRTLSVQRTVQRPKGGGWNFEGTKSKRGRRTIAIQDGLIVTLLEHRHTAPPSKHNLIFPALNGEPLEMNNVRNLNFKDVQEQAGLSGFNLYSLRHTHATLLLLAGVHPKVVSERLGHATIAITYDTYSHVLPNMQQEAAEKLEAILYKPTEEEDFPTNEEPQAKN